MTLTLTGQLAIVLWGVDASIVLFLGLAVLYRAVLSIRDLDENIVLLRGMLAFKYFCITTFHLLLGATALASTTGFVFTVVSVAPHFSHISGVPDWSLQFATMAACVTLIMLTLVQFAARSISSSTSFQIKYGAVQIKPLVFYSFLRALSILLLLLSIAQSASAIMLYEVIVHGVWNG